MGEENRIRKPLSQDEPPGNLTNARKILVVDDHALIRTALRGVLGELGRDVTVLEASDCRGALQPGVAVNQPPEETVSAR